jgi:hypothetical protein
MDNIQSYVRLGQTAWVAGVLWSMVGHIVHIFWIPQSFWELKTYAEGYHCNNRYLTVLPVFDMDKNVQVKSVSKEPAEVIVFDAVTTDRKTVLSFSF